MGVRPRTAIRRAAKWLPRLGLVAVVALFAVAWGRSDLRAPEETLWVEDRHGELIGELGPSVDAGLGYWQLSEAPPRVAAATLAVEDRRFWTHPGVDLRAVGRALQQNLREGERISGASTLAMQVARLQDPGPRTYPRKVLEAATALCLTARHGRGEVLRHYLRLVPYGNRVHGIAYAARRYFRKPVDDLSWAEVAFLAAVPQAPSHMNPYDPRGRGRAVERGRRILDQLHQDGLLDIREHAVASSQIVRLRIPPRPVRSPELLHALFYLRDLRPDGASPFVRTYLDTELQRELRWTAERRLANWRPRGAGNAAAMVVDLEGPDGPEVIAALGSADYFDDRFAGAINYFRIPRSSGSTLKPFLFAQALDRGLIHPDTVLDDLRRGAGGIGNSDGRFLGPMLPRHALATSRNVPAADLLAELGLDEGWALFRRLGLHDLDRSPERHGLGLVLGSLELTLEDLVGAYTALASDGIHRPPRWLRDAPVVPGERIWSPVAARQVSLFLADPLARLPVFPRRGATEPAYAAAVKTGTSSRYRDAWTVAYSSRYLVGAWVGHGEHRPMAGLSGYRSAARWVRDILDHLHPERLDGLDEGGFPPPADHVPVKLCALTGKAAGEACPRVSVERLRVSRSVPEVCNRHRRLAVDVLDGSLATSRTPRDRIELRTFLDLPPRYAAWQHREGIPRPPRRDRGGVSDEPAETSAGRLDILSPSHGLRVFQDPETPSSRSSIALAVQVDPPADQVLWRVDGEPYALVDYPFETRWHLEPGDHWIQAEVPYTGRRSRAVRIEVD